MKYILTWNTTLLSRNMILNNIVALLLHSEASDIIFIPQKETSIYLKGFYLKELFIKSKKRDDQNQLTEASLLSLQPLLPTFICDYLI